MNPFSNELYFVNASIAHNLPLPGTEVPAHYAFMLMLEGEFTYAIDSGPARRVKKGDLAYRFSNRQMKLQGRNYKYMFVAFNGSKAAEFMQNAGCIPEKSVLQNCPHRIENLMHEIMKALPTQQTNNPYFFLSRIHAIAEEIWGLNHPPTFKREISYTARIKQILEELNYRCSGTTELAKILEINPDTLRKACLREIGMPAKDHLINLRIKRAKELLKTTSYKIEYIAHACGYSNDKNFFKSFKKHTGKTPSSWRKEHRKQFQPKLQKDQPIPLK